MTIVGVASRRARGNEATRRDRARVVAHRGPVVYAHAAVESRETARAPYAVRTTFE